MRSASMAGLGAVVGDQQRRGGRVAPDVQQQLAAARRHRRVERDEWFIQQNQLRLDRERAGDGHPPCHAERQRATETRRGMVRGPAYAAGRRQAPGSLSAAPTGCSRERCARAAGAAPGTRCRCAALRRRASRAFPEVGIQTADDPQQSSSCRSRTARPAPRSRARRARDRSLPRTGRSPRSVRKDLRSTRSRRITSAIASPSAPAVAPRPFDRSARPG